MSAEGCRGQDRQGAAEGAEHRGQCTPEAEGHPGHPESQI